MSNLSVGASIILSGYVLSPIFKFPINTFLSTTVAVLYIAAVLVSALYPFSDLPNVFQRYVTYRAASRAATQLVSNPQLVQLLQTQEAQARASCLEYECNQGGHSFFGGPHETNYRNYQPYQALRR